MFNFHSKLFICSLINYSVSVFDTVFFPENNDFGKTRSVTQPDISGMVQK